MEGVSRNSFSTKNNTAGIGYIMIPSNLEREEYVTSCYERERVCVYIEQSGSMVKDCYISQQALKDIFFPESTESLGSPVIFVSDNFHKKPMIVSTLSREDETQLLSEHKFRVEKFYDKNKVKIEGDAEKGILNIFVDDKEQYGEINVSVKGKEGGKLNIDTSNEVNVNGDEKVNVQTSGEINIKTIDSLSGNVKCEISANGSDVKIIPDNELRIGEFTEPLTLADSLIKLMDGLITEISNSLVSTSLGAQPLINKAQIAAYKEQLDTVKSKVTKSS
ncbi:MAG: hypothetical protein ACOC2U_04860 [bacterium]